MATLEQLEKALVAADKAGAADDARALAAEIRRVRGGAYTGGQQPGAEHTTSQPASRTTIGQDAAQMAVDLPAGAVRGAGSIGATILAPVDVASDLAAGRGLTLQSNRERRAAMDAGLETLGADPRSLTFRGGKMGGEIAGTLGMGGLLARGVAGATGLSQSAPIINALRTGGMTAGQAAPGAAGAFGNALVRATGGAITGAASAGLVNPEDVGAGALIGGALPLAAMGAGAVGRSIGQIMRGPAQTDDLAQAVRAARAAGLVIPPSQANPTLANRALEGFSGKITTAQNASAKNQTRFNALAAQAIDLPAETKLTPAVLDDVRKEAGRAYADVAELGAMDAAGANLPKSVKVSSGMDPLTLNQKSTVDAAEVVRAWKQANHDATAYYRAYARDANPETLAKAKSFAGEAKRIDEFLAGKLEEMGESRLESALRDARVRIAKTYDVESALNPSTGNIDARKLAAMLKKDKPLSNELRTIADFSGRFPKASQPVEGMGSLPQASPLDWGAAAALSAITQNPLGMASVFARPAARALTLSPAVQNRLIQNNAPNALSQLLQNQQAQQLMYRSAPILADQ